MARSMTRPRMRLAAACLALCGGCGASPALASTAAFAATASQNGSSSTFVVGSINAVENLNPFIGYTGQDSQVYGVIYDNLMDYGQLNYAGTPRLATSWSHSKNGLVWTYDIR